ncbi:hypothetical protein C9374_003922 [Naegleria lovaniensis]|uniref:Uncharacterized protein n=1 Tax=Naegleria lovaniensis TaxID=51637 RepID=A0AA88H007_NAELO|nr:uncharacterized protein C9374_003922 [Naegleria lovaniensis]KAG2394158.1 hypothetical protein C9374_003922 [Naegleria lovaniensis]
MNQKRLKEEEENFTSFSSSDDSNNMKKRKMNIKEIILESNSLLLNNCIHLKLIDLYHPHFGNEHDQHLWIHHLNEKLCTHMRSKIRNRRPFSMNFQLVHSLGKKEKNKKKSCQDLGNPMDVKISYNQRVIVVTDNFNDRLVVFDLDSYRFKTSLFIRSLYPKYICIEENYMGESNDALICNSDYDREIFKCDLKKLLHENIKNSSTAADSFIEPYIPGHLWTTRITSSTRGIAVNKGLVFACDPGDKSIKVLDSSNGVFIRRVTALNGLPSSVDVTNDDQMIVTSLFENTTHVYFLSRQDNGEWEVVKIVHLKDVHGPSTVIYDTVSNHLLLTNELSNSILVTNKEGSIVTTFSSYGPGEGELQTPVGLCLNIQSGELLVCSLDNGSVEIFK